ncbi:hypothetical protein BsWGS_27070 [Bradybaena similaris]
MSVTCTWCLSVCLCVSLFAVSHQNHLEQYSLSLFVGEDAPVGTLVGEVKGETFGPPYSRWIFQATDNRTMAAFHVDLVHGRILTKGLLDREDQDRHTIIINTSLLRAKLLIIDVRILDVNDVTPTFLTPSVSANIPESAPRYHRIPLGDVRDEDLGENTTQKVEIISGNDDNDFSLEMRNSSSVDKMVDLVVNYQLDFERTRLYRLVVQATDGGGRSSLMSVNINVLDQNDNEPIFNMSKYSTRVLENVAVGAPVIQVFASDSDSGENSRIEYSIDSRTDPEAYFSMDVRTGEVRVSKPLDYETHDRFSVTVQAKDNGTPAQMGTAALDIVVEGVAERTARLGLSFQPRFRTGHIPEDTAAETLVAVVTLDGLDISPASGVNASLYNSQGYFLLTTGYFLGLYVSSSLDREAIPRFDMTLQMLAQGSPPLRAHTVFSIVVDDVNDNPPVFERAEYVSHVEEAVEVGAEVVRVLATDADAGVNGQITFHMDRDSHNLGWFSVDPDTGMVRTVSRLDCHLRARVVLVVVAKDGGAPPLSSSVQVIIHIRDTNDQAPEFETSFYSITVAENRRVGDCILVVSATDLQCGATMPVLYRMTQMLVPPKEFRVETESGAVCVRSELDFEVTNTYQFQVEAVDTGGLSSQAVVQIDISDVNDNQPRFEPWDYPLNVLSGVGPGPLVTVQARDRDSGRFGTVSYKIADGNDKDYFHIDPSTGAVSLTKPLPESEGVYSLRVQATDGGGMTSSDVAVVTVSVISGAVQPPVFVSSMFNLSVSEDAELGHVVGQVQARLGHIVGQVQARLEDTGADVDLVYSSLFQTCDWFGIDSWTGSIYTRSRLDRERHPFVLVSVQAQTGFPPVYATAQVNVTILDVNDNEPHFSATTVLELDVWEDQGIGTALYIARATDLDVGSNGSVRYQLYNGLDSAFEINDLTGEISLLKWLDYEQQQEHVLVVIAEDLGTPFRLSSNMTLRVKVKDVNDNRPVFDQAVYEFFLPENAPVGHPIGRVQATDLDSGPNKRLSYSFENGQYDSVFGISAVDGTVWIQRVLDRELKDTYKVTVRASDHGSPIQLSETALIKVVVTDVNDNGPVFSRDEYRFYIRENLHSGCVVGHVVADDLDAGRNGQVHYFFSKPQTYFTISAQSGEIRSQVSLDRERIAEHLITVYASDRGDNPRTAVTMVRVTVEDDNDNQPSFLRQGPQSIQVSENRPKGTEVISLEAVDLDEGDNSRLSYFFDQDQSESTALASFQIHRSTGRITTKQVLDFERQPVYQLMVVARDHGETVRQTSLPLTISVLDTNDQAMLQHSQLVSFDCVENSGRGTVVGHVKATQRDPTHNSNVTFYLIGGNVFSSFSIGQDSGIVTATGQLDYEKCSSHSLSVLAVHSSSMQSRNEYIKVSINIIDINDNPPVFEQDPVVLRNIAENTPAGHVIHKFTASDLDSGLNGTVHYLLEPCCEGGENSDPHLDIHPETGELFVSGTLDFEMKDQISVIVRAEDSCPTQDLVQHSKVTAILYITDVNDNTPEFRSSDNVVVCEDEDVGAVVVLVVAVDADANVEGSGNNVIRYNIVSGNEDGKFALAADTGYLTVREGLDYESQALYTLNISAEDQGTPRMTAYQTLVITVTDVNDNAPVFDHPVYLVSLIENSRPHTAVLRVLAMDADTGANGHLTYFIPAGAASDKFVVHPEHGTITTSCSLDREFKDTYNLTVLVKDGAQPVHYSSCCVIITITDQNDNIPDFKNLEYSVRIQENRALQVALTIVAYDTDLADNARITYSITGGNDGKFSIDPDTGALSSQVLDREMTSEYCLTISATDHGIEPLSATTKVIVTVVDENDNDPAFTEKVYRTAIAEDTENSTMILTVSASDPDEDENGRVTYSLGLQTDGHFKINSLTGDIYTCGKFDRETSFRYTFLVVATDCGLFAARNSTSQVVVMVTDVNDNAPRFSQVPYKVSLGLFTPPNTYLMTVKASDPDLGNNGLVEYSLLGTSEITQVFRIDRTTGEVSSKSSLFLVSGDYTLLVQALDSADYPASQLHSTGIIEITVGSGDSIQFEFSQSEYRVEIPEHYQRGSSVISVTAKLSSGDLPSGPKIYSIVCGNEHEAFSIHAGTGHITVAESAVLDYETTPSFHLVLRAAVSKHHTYATLWVNLTDINDNTPEFSQSNYISAIWENNHSDTYVGQVIARDADSGLNGEIIYSIIDGNRDLVFQLLRPTSGIVVTNSEAAPLDREAQPQGYRLTIEARDRGQPSRFSTCVLLVSIIDENDTPPLFPEIPPVNISESEDVGYTVTMATANDVDLNSVLVYDFTTDGNPDNTFSIDSSSGRLSLAKRVDFEKRLQYSVGIQVTDGKADHARSVWLDVFITDNNDNPPVFSQPVYQVTLPEQTGAHMSVITVTATDADLGPNAQITYSLMQTASDIFHIHPITGLIYSSQAVSLDESTVQLQVIATDGGTEMRSAMATVYVHVSVDNKYTPTFVAAKEYVAHIDECAEKGDQVLQVSAVDEDHGPHRKDLTYSLVGPGSEMFTINPRSGRIASNESLDFEVKRQYDLTVVARDQGSPPRNTSVPVMILVDDCNDNPPVFLQDKYSVFLDENAQLDDAFLTLETSDADSRINAAVQYFILSGNSQDIFLNPNNEGKLMIREGFTLDYELQSLHHLIIKAVDCIHCPISSLHLSAFVAVDVYVNDINEFAPRFPVRHYTEKLVENCQLGTVVFVAHANDDDSGQMGVVTYSIRSELDYRMFAIDAFTGQVTTKVEFDYERDRASHVYNLVIVAMDGGHKSDVTDVTVQILDVDEFDPYFTEDEYIFEVPGSAQVGDFVGQVLASDEDGGEAGNCVYSFLEGNDYFSIDPQSGNISVATSLRGRPAPLTPDRNQRKTRALATNINQRKTRALATNINQRKTRALATNINQRKTRALATNRLDLIIQVSSGQPGSRLSTSKCVININRTCSGCAAVLNEMHTPLDVDGGILAGIIVGCIIIIMLTICGILCLVYQHKSSDKPMESYGSHSPVDFDPPTQLAHNRSVPADFIRVNFSHSNSYVTSDALDPSLKSASSDWDLDEADDEDDEITKGSPRSLLHSTQVCYEKVSADSELCHGNVALLGERLLLERTQPADLEPAFMTDGQRELFVTDFMTDGQLKHYVTGNSLNNNTNYCYKPGNTHHSLCLYENHGIRFADDVDIQTLIDLQTEANAATLATRTQVIYLPESGSQTFEQANRQEVSMHSDHMGSLLHWGSHYQSLADVFSEIAQLKDETLCANRRPVVTVPQQRTVSLQPEPSLHQGRVHDDIASNMFSIPSSTAPFWQSSRCIQTMGTQEHTNSPVSVTCVCHSHMQQPSSGSDNICSYHHYHVQDRTQVPELCDILLSQRCHSTSDYSQHLASHHTYPTCHHQQNTPTSCTLQHLQHLDQQLTQQHLQHLEQQHLYEECQQHHRSLTEHQPPASAVIVPSTTTSPPPASHQVACTQSPVTSSNHYIPSNHSTTYH